MDESPETCMFHFEGYSCFSITRAGIKRIGPFDENFWPAYSEDCDYWFRARVVGCKQGRSNPHAFTPSLTRSLTVTLISNCSNERRLNQRWLTVDCPAFFFRFYCFETCFYFIYFIGGGGER